MKIFSRIIVPFILLSFLFSCFSFTYAMDKVGKVTYIIGAAVTKHKGSDIFRKLKKNQIVYAFDDIKTRKNSKVEITFEDKSVLRIASSTYVKIIQEEEKNKIHNAVYFTSGQTWVNAVMPKGKWGAFKTKTPLAVASIKGTVYRTAVYENKANAYMVYEGEVEVAKRILKKSLIEKPVPVDEPGEITLDEWVEVVGKMQQIYIEPTGEHTVSDIPEEDSEDPWVMWNQERDFELEDR